MPRSGPRRATVAALAFLLLAPAIASADWLADMPTVDEVAWAVREQNRADVRTSAAGIEGVRPDDPDWYAARLAGTFEMLRWHMLFEALRETNAPVPPRWRPLWPPKDATLQRAEKIAAEYRQMELALESAVGKRPAGNHKRLCTARHTFLNRAGQKMFTPQECYQFLFDRDSDLKHIFAYRTAIFPRLFCGHGAYYNERYQQYFTDGMRAPRSTWDRPQNYVYKRIHNEPWPAIAQAKSTAEVCAGHGGDTDGNGICDTWQAALKNPAADAGRSHCALCPDPQQSGPPPYSSVVQAVWDAGREAVMRSKEAAKRDDTDEFEWGGFVYLVQGGFRYLAPVTSNSEDSLDLGAVAAPAFDKLFGVNKPQSCKPVATFHTHPSFWSVPGLSLGDLQNALGTGLPAYVMRSSNTKKLYVYEPGKSSKADEAIWKARPIPDKWHAEVRLNLFNDYVDVLTEE